MFKQSPSGNYKSQGIKVKRVLQIFFLLASCFWLSQQVSPSHDQKKIACDHENNDAKAPSQRRVGYQVLKLGRKDLHPPMEETSPGNAKHDGGGGGGGDQEEEKKELEVEEEDRGGGDDEIDELNQEREFEGVEDFTDVQEDRQVDDKKATKELSLEEAIDGDKGEVSENIIAFQNSPLLSPELATEPKDQPEVANNSAEAHSPTLGNTTLENTYLGANDSGHENKSNEAPTESSNQIDSTLVISPRSAHSQEPDKESSNSSATSEFA